jgi:hypothetical protein
MGEGSGAPVAAGLAVGAALVVHFASIFSSIDHSFTDNRNHIDIAIQGLKDAYASGERIALTTHISGYTDVCDSSPVFRIVDSDGNVIYNYFSLKVILCDGDGQINRADTILTTEGPENELGDVAIYKDGNYKVIAGQYGKTVEKEFAVVSSNSVNSITSEQVPEGTKVGVKITDSQDDVDSPIDSVDPITFDHELNLNLGEQRKEDAHNFALGITKDLNEVNEFQSIYPNANTTVYFIKTCADESCSTLSWIPSVVEYSYKTQDQKYADLRVEINYEEGQAVFSQARCTIYDTEQGGIELHGAVPLEGVAAFLQDSQCP